MKKIMLLVCILSSIQLFAQVRTASFQSAGYDDQTITGVSGALNYYLKIKPSDNPDNSALHLSLQPSGIINGNYSFVVLYVKNNPVATFRISGTDSVINLSVPLKKEYLQADGRFIQLKIQAQLASSDEICRDLNNPAIWLKIKKSSYLTFAQTTEPSYQPTITEFLQNVKRVALPATNTSITDITAAGIAYTLLKKSITDNHIIPVQYYQSADSVSDAFITGLYQKLPSFIATRIVKPASGQGIIQSLSINGNTYLVVTAGDEEGYKKVVKALSYQHILSGSFTNKLIISQAAYNTKADNGLANISLQELGGSGEIQEGVGNLQSLFTFSSDLLSTLPTSASFHLEANYAALKETDRGFLNIYLNENLVHTEQLNASGHISNHVNLPAYLLNKFNTLKVEFRFNPGSSICKDGFRNYFAGIDIHGSQLSFSGNQQSSANSFFYFPMFFKNKPTAIVVSPELQNKAALAIGELLYQINKHSQGQLIFPAIYASNTEDSSIFSDGNIIACLSPNDDFIKRFDKIPVRYDKNFIMYPDENRETKFTAGNLSGSGMAQIFSQNGKTILAITSWGEDSSAIALTDVIKAMNQQITNLESNVCIANGSGSYFFRSSDNGRFVLYSEEGNQLEKFWKKYQYWLLGVALILIILAFFFVSGKVKQSQAIINDNTND